MKLIQWIKSLFTGKTVNVLPDEPWQSALFGSELDSPPSEINVDESLLDIVSLKITIDIIPKLGSRGVSTVNIRFYDMVFVFDLSPFEVDRLRSVCEGLNNNVSIDMDYVKHTLDKIIGKQTSMESNEAIEFTGSTLCICLWEAYDHDLLIVDTGSWENAKAISLAMDTELIVNG